jgi:hypothetical protein
MRPATEPAAVAGTPEPAAPAPPMTPALRLELAIARLEASRQALRHEMMPEARSESADDDARRAGPWRLPLRRVRALMKRWPLTQVAGDAVRGWWQHHPWRATGDLLADGLWPQLRPLVRRHPVAAAATAAAAGALVVAGRPWRWPVVGAQLRPLPSRALHWVVAQLTTVPMQTAIATLLMTALRRPDAEPAAPADAAPDTPRS